MTSAAATENQHVFLSRVLATAGGKALAAGTLAWIAMSLWALASPIGSVPDEPSHYIRAAAVVRGEFVAAQSTQNPAFGAADVPNYVAHVHEWTCFAFDAQISASCMAPVTGDGNAEVVTVTSAASNSPAYYAIVGLPSLMGSGTPALYAMRLLNALVCAVAVGVAAFYLPSVTRARWSWVALMAAVTPMVAYLGGSVNPNGAEAVSGAALLVVVLAALRTAPTGRRLVGMLGWLTVMTSLLLSTRSIAMLWLALILVVATLLAGWRAWIPLLKNGLVRIALGVMGVIALVTLAWYANPPTYGDMAFGGVGTSFKRAFVEMLLNTFGYAEGYIGFFGWVDTHSPGASVIAFSAVLVALIVAGIAVSQGRRLWAVVFTAGSVLIVPAIVQGVLAASIGFIWQGRYMLAMVMVALVTAGIAIDDARAEHRLDADAVRTPELRVVVAAVALLAVGHAASFAWTLRRYVVGEDDTYLKMFRSPEWQPPGTWIVLTALYGLTLAITALAVWQAVRSTRQDRLNTGQQTAG